MNHQTMYMIDMSIPVYNQIITDEDAKMVYESVKSGFVTQIGSYVSKLEEVFSKKFKRHAVTCSNGTTALHLAILALNLDGATIAVPSCVFASVAFAPIYAGCNLEFVEMDMDTWNFDLNSLEKLCKQKRIDAFIAVHNYGNPYDYFSLKQLSDKYEFYIIEDACEALGSVYEDRLAGNMGDISVFSFFGNKIITGGEGGILLIDDVKIVDRIKLLRSQAVQRDATSDRFNHIEIGYNYRITNMQASLIFSQFNRLEETVSKCHTVAKMYKEKLSDNFIFQKILNNAIPNWWMVSIMTNIENGRNVIENALNLFDIDSRPIFRDLRSMKPWGNTHNVGKLFQSGITLPSGPNLDEQQVDKICSVLQKVLKK